MPPVAVALSAAVAMWCVAAAVDWLIPVPAGARMLAAGALALAGAGIGIAGVVAFRRARTTVNPFLPDNATALVVTGVYRYSRNPMYLGLLLGLAGWAVFLSNAAAFLILPLFVSYMNRFQIAPEERVLAARFPEEFAGYGEKVRKWL